MKDIFRGNSGSGPAFLTPVGSRHLYFVANDGNTGPELWRSDGTTQGTKLIEDTLKGRNGLGPSNTIGAISPRFAVVNGIVYFAAHDGKSGRELWSFDNGGTATPVGTTCNSTVPTLSASDPLIGSRLAIVTKAPQGAQTVVVLGIPGRAFQIGSCAVRLNLAVPLIPLLYGSTSNISFGLNIPKNIALVGLTGRLQSAYGGNGWILFSNAVDLRVGK